MATLKEELFEKLEQLYLETTGHEIQQYKHYHKNQHVYHFGEIPKGIYYIKEGSVKVTRFGANGREIIIRVAQSHDFVGYLSLLKSWSYKTSAISMEESEIYFIAKPIFMKSLHADHDFAYGVIDLLCDKLFDSTQGVIDLATKSVKQRLCTALLTLQNGSLTQDHTSGIIRFKRKDIAAMIGTIPETVSRQLAELEKEDMIRASEKHLEIINRDKLARLSKLGD